MCFICLAKCKTLKKGNIWSNLFCSVCSMVKHVFFCGHTAHKMLAVVLHQILFWADPQLLVFLQCWNEMLYIAIFCIAKGNTGPRSGQKWSIPCPNQILPSLSISSSHPIGTLPLSSNNSHAGAFLALHFHPILENGSTVLLLMLCMYVTLRGPPCILKWGELESSGWRLIP